MINHITLRNIMRDEMFYVPDNIVNVHEEAASVCIDILLYFTYWSTLSHSTGFVLLCIVVSSLFYIYILVACTQAVK